MLEQNEGISEAACSPSGFLGLPGNLA